jgi:polyhydroxyalkanoate synthesis regulator phasin
MNEVVKDLVKKVQAQQQLIETQNKQIQQMTEMLQKNNNLKPLSRQEQ